MLQTVVQQLSNYFLNPLGLAALLGIIPLIIFYLMRPSPEEKIMPSMEFFQQEKKSGRLQKALKILQRNMMLILHILMVAGLATAIANPYILQEQRPENAVVLLDNSASMKPVFNEVKQETVSNLGKTNTVITVNDEVEVEAEKASFSKSKKIIRDIDVEETGTDIARGLREIRDYEGKVFVASDLDQSTGSEQEINSLLNSISSSRPLKVYSPKKENKWGIVDMKRNKDNATVFIQNYRDEISEVSLEVGSDTQQVKLEGESLRKITFTLEKGKNTVKLENDGFEVDNRAYVNNPESQVSQVSVIADEQNRYLMKALELIQGVNATYQTPSENPVESDVYIVGRTGDKESINSKMLSDEVKSGKGVVIFAQPGITDLDIQDSPVKSVGDEFNSSVSLTSPISLQLDNITMYSTEFDGKSLSIPSEGLEFANYGAGEIAIYNLGSKRFRTDIMYPVFWKQTLERLSPKLSVSELNRRTGDTILTDEKAVELKETGYTDLGGNTYASNLFNGDESSFQEVDESSYSSDTKVKEPSSVRNIPIIAILILSILELIYLKRAGEIP